MSAGSASGAAAGAGGAPLLRVRGLDVALPPGADREHAIRGLDLELSANEILCVVGESGSGKSMTASALMRLLPTGVKVVAGGIEFDGRDLLALDEAQMREVRGAQIAMVFQEPMTALNPLRTVGDQIGEMFRIHTDLDASAIERKVLALLAEVRIPDPAASARAYPHELSGGQRQRAMIAMALALEPRMLIADEPTTALDVTTQAQILALIRDLQRRKGTAVLFITHDFGVVADIADRVIVMEKGKLVEQGPASRVLAAPEHPYTQRLIASVPRLREADQQQEQQEVEAPVILKVEGLNKTYRATSGLFGSKRVVPAVQDASFELRRGRTLGVVGESGSGKSSMGRVLMKLTDADGGRILLEGKEILSLTEAEFRPLRPRIQMVFQDPYASLNPRQTVGSSLTVGPVAHGMASAEARAKAAAILAQVGLDPAAYDRFPHEFSGGQRQRIGIARALMFDPEIIVADEAVSALDVSIQAQILELLARVQAERHLAMIFITHDLRVASQICDEVLVMHKGRVVESGPPARIFRAPEQEYTKRLVAAIPGMHWESAL